MTAEARGVIRLTQAFTASADRVFDAWLSPEKVARWLRPDAVRQVTKVEIDARVGGSFRFVTHCAGRAEEQTGKYLDIQRPRRLSFTIRSSASAGTERVTVLIEPRGAGCFLTLISKIEPAPLHAIAPLATVESSRVEKLMRPRWPRLEAKAALSLGLHLAMLPLLPIVLREPAPPPGAGPAPLPAIMTVDVGSAERVQSHTSEGEATARPRPALPEEAALLPLQPSAPAPQLAAQQSPAAARPAPHVATSGSTLPVPPPATARQAKRMATNRGPGADWPDPQALNALGTPPLPADRARMTIGAAGEDGEALRHQRRAVGAQVEQALAGTNCIGTIGFSQGTYYGGQQTPVEAHFFRDRNGKPWIRFTLWPGAPWDLPVTIAGGEIRWSSLNGGGYALRPAANNHLVGFAGFNNDYAAKIDFTCAGSDAHAF